MGKSRRNIKILFYIITFAIGIFVSDIGIQAAELPVQETGVEITATTLMYAVKNVNVRKEPNTSSEILGELQAGDNIFAVELTAEGWYRVVYEGETGYIRGDFLAVFGSAGEWAESETEPEYTEEDIAGSMETDAGETDTGSESTDENNTDNSDDNEADNADGTDKAADTAKVQDSESKSNEEQDKGKNDIYTILILVILVVVIFVYAVIQIINDKNTPDGEYDEDSDEEEYEDSEEDIELLDLDEEK